jgi:ATP-dependent DNA helicase RecG
MNQENQNIDKFLLQKQGKRWDAVPTPYVTVKDLAKTAFQYFRKNAIQSNRLDDSILKHTASELLKKLHLTEGNYLKRAAILLFHPDPEVYVTGAYIKIGYFRTDTELLYQDEVHGYLFEQVEKTMDLLLTKYLKAYISYQGLHRKETYPMPISALREALLNAIAHKDYSGNTPIQIKVYDDKLVLWNQGQLPENWTVADLLQTHTSVPYNPAIANAFFRAGLIEAWGSGTLRIMTDCEAANASIPIFQYHLSGFGIEFPFKMSGKNEEMSGKIEEMSGKNEEMSRKNEEMSGKNEEMSGKNIAILTLIKGNSKITIPQMAKQLSVSSKTIERLIKQLKEAHQLRRKDGAKGGEWELISE